MNVYGECKRDVKSLLYSTSDLPDPFRQSGSFSLKLPSIPMNMTSGNETWKKLSSDGFHFIECCASLRAAEHLAK